MPARQRRSEANPSRKKSLFASTLKKLLGATALIGTAGVAARIAKKTHDVTDKTPQETPQEVLLSTDDAMVERLFEMMRIPTITGSDSVQKPFTDFESYLRSAYPLLTESLKREHPRKRRCLLYTWEGSNPDLNPLVLMAHYDVVDPGEQSEWGHNPFEPYIDDDGVIHGRGCLDDKGCLLIIMEAVEQLISDDFTPERTVYIALGGNEETVGVDGPNPVPQLFAERGITPWMVLDEGGAVIDAPLPGIDKRLAVVGVSEKGVLSLKMTAHTDGGHASTPSKDSAIFVLAEALDDISNNTFPRRMPQPMQQMLDTLAPYAPVQMRAALANIDLLNRPAAEALGRTEGELGASMHTTVAATMIEGGTAPNALPTEASATLNIRIALGESIESVIKHLRRQVDDDRISFEVLEGDDPSPISPTDNAQYDALKTAIAGSWPDALPVPYVMLACSDARFWHKHWPDVYRFCPMYMSAEQRKTIHGFGENLNASELSRGKMFHMNLLKAVAGKQQNPPQKMKCG